MSEENITEEALQLVKEAHSPKVFNLSDAIKNRAYPTKDVTIYLDDQSAMRLVEINDKMSRTLDPKELKELEEQSDELAKTVMASSLVFHLKGVGQDAIDAITKSLDSKYSIKPTENGTNNPDWLRDYITTLVCMNIKSVTDASGAVDETEFDFEKTDELRKVIAPSEWGKLVGMMQKLTLAGGYFDQLTDAGFLQKS